MSVLHDPRWPLAALISLALLAGIWVERQMFHLPAGDPDAYHAQVRRVAANLPSQVGEWTGSVVDTPPAAVALLRPNVLLGRRFQNPSTGEHATLMLVQCRDARDMGGHYPPNCYPAHGWILQDAKQKVLSLNRGTLPVAVYRFTFESPERFSESVIYNFFVCPDGRIDSGQDGVSRAASDARSKVFGAAQFQVIFDSPMTEQRMDAVFRILVSGALPVLDAIRDGGAQ